MPHLGQAWRVKSTNFSPHRKVLQRTFVTFMASLKNQINNFSLHRTVVQRNDMPHLWQASRVKSTNLSVHRIIMQTNVMSPLEQAWRVKSINIFAYRTVVQWNVMPHLRQAWKIKFLDTKESFAENFCHFYGKSEGLNQQISLHTWKSCREMLCYL